MNGTEAKAISIPGCRVTSTGLEIEGELTPERWDAIGQALSAVNRCVMWVVGDWLLAGESAGYLPRGKLAEACERFGIAYDTAKRAASVCRSFESGMRIPDLTFSHYQLLANCDNATDLIGWSIENNATVVDLRSEKKRRQRNIGTAGDTIAAESIQSIVELEIKYGTIYVDPPWQYGNQSTRAATDNHYPTMPIEEIAGLPVSKLAADKCHLHLWTTNGFLKDALWLIEEWGFEFKSTFIWVKPQLGIGNYWRCSHEILLLGVKGGLTFEPSNIKSWIKCKRTKHSAKPREVRDLIEQVSPEPRIELFARSAADGWTVWGNQIELGMFDSGVRQLN